MGGRGQPGVLHMIVRWCRSPANTARVEIDQEKIYKDPLKDDWDLLVPKEISDPADKKSSDRVDNIMMEVLADISSMIGWR